MKKQSGGLFFSRGNERSEAIGTAVPRQNPFGRAITIRLHRKMQPYFFCSTKPKGFEQGVKKQSGRLFFSRGNERSEAIGTAVPRENPFGRAMIVLL